MVPCMVLVGLWLREVLQKLEECSRTAGKIPKGDQACGESLTGRKGGTIGAEKLKKEIKGETLL